MNLVQAFFGISTVIVAFAYALARKYRNDEYLRTFTLMVLVVLVVMFLLSLRQ